MESNHGICFRCLLGAEKRQEIETVEMTAEEWISSYADLEQQYLRSCADVDDLWELAKAMAEDAAESGATLDPMEVFRILAWKNSL